jgi:hypothetical protein
MNFKLLLMLIVIIEFISSCQYHPHEARSICTSIESDNPYIRNPCIRRPANSKREIVISSYNYI